MTEKELILMIGEIHADVKTLLANSTDHGKRIGSLEGSRSYYSGALWVIGGVMTLVLIPAAKALLF